MPKIKLPWQDPLKFAQKIADNYTEKSWVFLYSGLSDQHKDSYSYLALFPQKEVIEESFAEAQEQLEKLNQQGFSKWFGYLSYELAQDFEKIPSTKKSPIDLPKIWLINFSLVFEFNHQKQELSAIYDDKERLDCALSYLPTEPQSSQFNIANFESNFTDDSYLKTIDNIKNKIAAGDFYQTNLTRKFFGEFTKTLDHHHAFQLFTELAESSPANYSSFLKLEQNYIISSSPELFLKIEKNHILSRPIKGTAPRSADPKQDLENKNFLKNNSKERAENLMIVDLVRNDLARICKAGSVKVENLFQINSYRNVHHMSSEIAGELLPNIKILSAFPALFPPGSMTGAPKIKAMEIAAQEEKINRGVYSGTIGMIDFNGITNLAVVIRTLIINKKKFEFQVGGAITFDSDPKAELNEIYSKAKGVMGILGLQHNQKS